MDKPSIIKKLASLNGIKQEYFDNNGKLQQVSLSQCSSFLNMIGIPTDSTELLAKKLNDIELKFWQDRISPVKVCKKNEFPVVQVRMPVEEMNSSFEWILSEEDGAVHSGEFFTSELSISAYKEIDDKTYYQFDLPLTISPSLGYHNLQIRTPFNEEYNMSLIITPEQCYQNEFIKKEPKIWGPKLRLHTIATSSTSRIADSGDLKYIIKKVAHEKGGIVGISAVNQVTIRNKTINPYIPSSKVLFNTIYIDIDRTINFIQDKSVELQIEASKFAEYLSKLDQSESINFLELYEKKFIVYKALYQSFRENHLNRNTDLAHEFQQYLSFRGDRFYKLALFRALEDLMISEDPTLDSWHDWPEPYKNPYSDVVKNFECNNRESIQFYQFIQWQSDLQLKEAGKVSFEKGLQVGLLVDIPYCVDINGADTWACQHYYTFNGFIKPSNKSDNSLDEFSIKCPPLIPIELINNAYSYLVDNFRANMIHSGAVNIENLSGYESILWKSCDSEKDSEFYVKYPFEDIMGIIALESYRNKCIVLADDFKTMPPRLKQAVLQYGIYSEFDFKLKEITSEEDLVEIFNKDIVNEIPLSTPFQIAKVPVSTYRLQLNSDFTFNDAKNFIPYLKKLGISHCYISPVLHARSNSTHGYDIINHNEFHPSIGSRQEFDEFSDELHNNGMGLILDIVPNHMGINSENKWWMDVLENGQSSQYASYFDIDWNPIKKELLGKLLVPILGDHYGVILENGELKLEFLKLTGNIILKYWDHMFPINPSSYPTILSHRIDVLESRIGSTNPDLYEYQSIVTALNNLPNHTETDAKLIQHRIRERKIAYSRLSSLACNNNQINEFIEENLQDFQSKSNDPISTNRLHNLLEEQAYRLAYWRVSVDEINYRRFFDVNDLAAICVENPEVFAKTHNFIMELIEQRKIDGLRLDHPDGLFEPTAYFKKLQKEAAKRLNLNFNEDEEILLSSDNLPIYVLAEKITAPFETLPANWAIHGTVGYEFLNKVNGLFVDYRNRDKFTKIYNKFINKSVDFERMVIECKKLIMKTSLTGELNMLSNFLNRISEQSYNTRDYTLNSLRDTLTEIIAHFPVYRTYISTEDDFPKGSDYIKWAVRSAKKKLYSNESTIFDFIEKILLLELEEDRESDLFKQILNFTMKFQQFTSPLMAKGMEDTSFYRYNRLSSLNEVGGEPNHFGVTVDEFHSFNQSAHNITPYNLLSTSTHDTKRSEDIRVKISLLSEIPDVWQKKVSRFNQLNKLKKTKIDEGLLPDKNDEYLFYQALLGIWPDVVTDKEHLFIIINRLEEYMIKAVREAKIHTSWVNMNVEYEDAMKNFIRKVLLAPDKHPFWKEFLPFAKQISSKAKFNSLSQQVLKLISPGVPDIYQGTEVQSLCFVDPDNRKAIDTNYLSNLLNEIEYLNTAENFSFDEYSNELKSLNLDKKKLFLTTKLLNYRKSNEELFKMGDYIPIPVEGDREDNIIAFARKYNEKAVIVVVPRFIYHITDDSFNFIDRVWDNSSLILPDSLSGLNWKSLIDNNSVEPEKNKISINCLFKTLSVEILESTL